MEPAVKAAIITAAGVVVAALIGALVRSGRRRRARSNEVALPSQSVSSVEQAAPDPDAVGRKRIPLREQSASEVFLSLKAIREPLKRQEMIRHSYVGRWVKWSGRVQSVRLQDDIYSRKPDHFSVCVCGPEAVLVFFDLPLAEEARVSPMAEGDYVEYEGAIRNIESIVISLTDAQIIEHCRVEPGSTKEGQRG